MSKEPPQYNKIEPGQLNWVSALGQFLSVFILRFYFRFFFKSYTVLGNEKIPDKTLNYVVVSNHLSMWDPPIISVALRYRRIAYMAKIELFRHPLAALYFSRVGAFAVNRDRLEMATVKSAKAILKEPGWLLGVFPEGTRNQEGKMGEAKKGAAFLAQTAKVGILPMAHLTKGKDGKEVYVKIGDFIPYDKEKSLEDLTNLVQNRLAELINDLDAL